MKATGTAQNTTTGSEFTAAVVEVTITLSADEAKAHERYLRHTYRELHQRGIDNSNKANDEVCYWGDVDDAYQVANWIKQELKPKFNPDQLLAAALSNDTVHEAFSNGRKIEAIKVLRIATECGLKEAKVAVEEAFLIFDKRRPF